MRSSFSFTILLATMLATTPLLGQTAIPLFIAFEDNLDDEDLDDIDFVEDLLDAGLPFAGGAGLAVPSHDPLTNDDDDEETRIFFSPVDVSSASALELNFAFATTGEFDSGAAFSVTAIGVNEPLFSVLGRALGDPNAPFFNFFDSPVVDAQTVLNADIDLTRVVFEVVLDPGFDGEDESIFFDNFTITIDPIGVDTPDDGPGGGFDPAGVEAVAFDAEGDSGAAVPEPNSLLLLVGVSAGVALRRARSTTDGDEDSSPCEEY